MQYIYTCTITYPAESGLDSVITTLKCLLSAAFKIRPVTTRDTPCTSIVVSSWIKPSPSSAILDRACSDISAKRSPRRNNSSLQDLKSCYKRYLALFRNIQYIHTHIKINLHTRTIYIWFINIVKKIITGINAMNSKLKARVTYFMKSKLNLYQSCHKPDHLSKTDPPCNL